MKLLIIVFLLISEFIFSQSYVQHDTISDTIIKKNVLKKYKKFLKHNFTRKERKERKENVSIFLIYWMECSIDSLSINDTILKTKMINESLKFKAINKLRKRDTHYWFSGLIYNKQGKVVASYNETDEVFCPSIFDKVLYQALEKYEIEFVFQIFNLKYNNTRKFLVDNDNKIYVYESFFTKNEKLSYKVVPFSKYTSPLVLE